MSAKKPNVKLFVKSENRSVISLEYVQKVEDSGIFIIYFDIRHNPTKFQLNRIWTQTFQLKLFDIAMTSKYGQGHWKWYEQVKLNE